MGNEKGKEKKSTIEIDKTLKKNNSEKLAAETDKAKEVKTDEVEMIDEREKKVKSEPRGAHNTDNMKNKNQIEMNSEERVGKLEKVVTLENLEAEKTEEINNKQEEPDITDMEEVTHEVEKRTIESEDPNTGINIENKEE